MSVTSCQSSQKIVHKCKRKCNLDYLFREAKANVSYLSLACSSESTVFLYRYIFLIAIVLSCQRSKSRTEQSGCDAVLTMSWAHSSKSARAKGMISSCIWLRDYSQIAPTCPCIEPSFELSFNPSRELAVPGGIEGVLLSPAQFHFRYCEIQGRENKRLFFCDLGQAASLLHASHQVKRE